MITLDQIYDNIISQKFSWVRIQDSDGDQVAYLAEAKGKKVTPQEIKRFVSDFVKNNPGVYTFLFKKHGNASAQNIIRYKRVNASGSTSTGLQIVFDEELERKRIRLEIEEEERERIAKINYDQKAQELDMVFGKLEYLAVKFFSKYIPANQRGSLNGTTTNTTTTTTIMSHTPIPLEQLTQEQKDKSNEALLLLLQTVNPETLHAVATKLYNEPQTLQMLIQFVKP